MIEWIAAIVSFLVVIALCVPLADWLGKDLVSKDYEDAIWKTKVKD
jgi:hypothetical protein